jgi:hypothetical protein
LILLVWSFAANAKAQTEQEEAALKAVFIYNFTKYVDWDNIGNEFIIGVIGSSPIENALNEIARTTTVKNRRIIIRHYATPEDIRFCQILFIAERSSYTLPSILNEVGRGVLTVSEVEGYSTQGTAFNFVIRNDKLKFEANLKAIDMAGLKASSQLLKLAIIVN